MGLVEFYYKMKVAYLKWTHPVSNMTWALRVINGINYHSSDITIGPFKRIKANN